jgi:hypothetical protein
LSKLAVSRRKAEGVGPRAYDDGEIAKPHPIIAEANPYASIL